MLRRPEVTEVDVVGAIYEAAMDASRWGSFVDVLTRYMGTESADFFVEDTRDRQACFTAHNIAIDERQAEAYTTHYVFLDPSFRYRLDKPEGTVSASNLLLRPREFEESEFYQDFLRPTGIFHHVGATIQKDGRRVATVGMQRSRGLGEFTPAELRRVHRLVPHLRRALLIAGSIGAWRAERAAWTSVLEHLEFGVVVLDGGGNVLWANPQAESVAARNPELRLSCAGLSAARPEDARALRALIHGATATGSGTGVHPGGAVCIQRMEHWHPLRVVIAPLRAELTPLGFGPAVPRAVAFLSEPDASLQPDPAVLQHLFGLTPAEARLATALADGDSPDEIAARTQRSVLTVRTQIRRIYDKLGVRRQTQFVRRILLASTGFVVRRR